MGTTWKRIPADQSALIFEPNGSIEVLLAKHEPDAVVDMGIRNALRAMMLFGDSETSQYLRELVDEMIVIVSEKEPGHG